ncbi:MAG: glycosyltransferase [bacterium]|nr:glycosyltransferase [bacterium]
MIPTTLSLIIPVYNEEAVLEKNLKILSDYLSSLPVIENFEIIICDDGSTDRTGQILDQPTANSQQLIALHSYPSRHIGRAKKAGLEKAKMEYVMTYAIDLPFGLEIIERSLQAAQAHPKTFILGSKSHPQSQVMVPPSRKIMSKIFNYLLHLLYHLPVRDSQGTALFPRQALEKILPHLTAQTDFLQAQLLVFAKATGYQLLEIPVTYIKPQAKSKFTFLFHALPMFWELIAGCGS